jgi:hypothetical protein
VGICSTTYGDLVCRGCKRFSHEIVHWNGYDAEQKSLVWSRLISLRNEVLQQLLICVDQSLYKSACIEAGLQESDEDELCYQLLRSMVRDNRNLAYSGLARNKDVAANLLADASAEQGSDTLRTLQALDTEIYSRSKAHYERNFKVPV